MRVKVAHKVRSAYPRCRPGGMTVLNCGAWGVQRFVAFAELMWPQGVEYVEFAKKGHAGVAENQSVYGSLSSSTGVLAYANAASVSEERIRHLHLVLPLALASSSIYYHHGLAPKRSYLEKLLVNFKPISEDLWLFCAVVSLLGSALRSSMTPHRRKTGDGACFSPWNALVLGLNAAFLVKFYKVNLSAIKTAPSVLPFRSVDELTKLVAGGRVRIAMKTGVTLTKRMLRSKKEPLKSLADVMLSS